MCEIDILMKRINLTHDPDDKRILERMIKQERAIVRLTEENEKLKPFEFIVESLTA